MLLVVPGCLYATEKTLDSGNLEEIEQSESADTEELTTESRKTPILDLVEKERRRAESQAIQATQWVDSFFSDPEYEAEVATSQFRISPEMSYQDEQGWDGTVKLSFKFRLPNLDHRVSLIGGSSEFGEDFDSGVADDIKEHAIGLQFFGREHRNWDSSISVGMKSNDFAFFLGPRFRYQTRWSKRTSFRFVQKILWQTNNEWQLKSRFDFNFAVSDRLLFRQKVNGLWRGEYSDEEGYRTRLSSFLTWHLAKAAGLQSEATVIFHTEPDTHVDKYIFALRYRQSVWRDWFYYEVVPQLSWENEFDYKINPGLTLRIEIFYGTDNTTRFWKRKLEDTENFRW